eukprot:TRINITY_DN287_c0_g1_i7.p1 TRINITY_DN287_c0_g1~~TRINITY_DN287_c0_g1_i7.p1  ORF type:complete len:255 (-),score=47.51 TRINITY_DN287_c0_g1_i7:222-986(-)
MDTSTHQDVVRLCRVLFSEIQDLNDTHFTFARLHLERQVLKLFESIDHLHHHHDECFKLEIRPSTIPNAGHGLFLIGSAEAGDVIAIYPGMIYQTQDMSIMCDLVFTQNQYLIYRSDGMVVDGNMHNGISSRIWSMGVEKKNHKILQEKRKQPEHNAEMKVLMDNPFAKACYVNHSFEKDNVFCHDFEFPINFPKQFQCYIPNLYFTELSRDSIPYLVPSLVLVAKRKIENEEIFLNYKFNPNSPLPSWWSSGS